LIGKPAVGDKFFSLSRGWDGSGADKELSDECQLLRAEVRERKEKASKNSHNSSKPPSMMLGLLIYR
jgi:hypothetical protein